MDATLLLTVYIWPTSLNKKLLFSPCCRNICQTGCEGVSVGRASPKPLRKIFLGFSTQEALVEIFVIHSANAMKRVLKYI